MNKLWKSREKLLPSCVLLCKGMLIHSIYLCFENRIVSAGTSNDRGVVKLSRETGLNIPFLITRIPGV